MNFVWQPNSNWMSQIDPVARKVVKQTPLQLVVSAKHARGEERFSLEIPDRYQKYPGVIAFNKQSGPLFGSSEDALRFAHAQALSNAESLQRRAEQQRERARQIMATIEMSQA